MKSSHEKSKLHQFLVREKFIRNAKAATRLGLFRQGNDCSLGGNAIFDILQIAAQPQNCFADLFLNFPRVFLLRTQPDLEAAV
jgi:hypothetical protein